MGLTESFWYGDQYVIELSLEGIDKRTRHAAEKATVVHRSRTLLQNAASIKPAKTRSHTTGGVSAKHNIVKSTIPPRPEITFALYARMPIFAFSSSHPTI